MGILPMSLQRFRHDRVSIHGQDARATQISRMPPEAGALRRFDMAQASACANPSCDRRTLAKKQPIPDFCIAAI
jgi:hypothetical protein